MCSRKLCEVGRRQPGAQIVVFSRSSRWRWHGSRAEASRHAGFLREPGGNDVQVHQHRCIWHRSGSVRPSHIPLPTGIGIIASLLSWCSHSTARCWYLSSAAADRANVRGAVETLCTGCDRASNDCVCDIEFSCPAGHGSDGIHRVPRQIVAFVIPTGYSFNLDGSSLYLSVAAIFVAQVGGIHLGLGQQLP